MSLIDTYQLATSGQNFISTSTLASNGILIDIIIEPVSPPSTIPIGGVFAPTIGKEKKEKDYKKITVIVTIDGIQYKKTRIVKDKPNLKVEDVEVTVTESKNKPIIGIRVL